LSGLIVAAENVKGRGQRAVRGGALLVALIAGAVSPASTFAAPPLPPAPAPTQLPTGGQVAAGAATIAQAGSRMDVTQTTQRAVINWSGGCRRY
jgi:hypothetical protein